MMLLFALLLCFLAAVLIFAVVLFKSVLACRISCLIGTDRLEAEITVFFWKKELKSFKITEETFREWIKKQEADNRRPVRTGKDGDAFQPMHDWYRLSRQIVRTIRSLDLTERVCLSDFFWKTSCGVENAQATAMLCGIIWSVKYSVMPLIGKMMVGRPSIEVIPLFRKKQKKIFTSRLSCMITIKAGEAMLIMRQIRRQVKEGECNGGSSHSGLDEDSAGKSSVDDRRRNDYRRTD
ncbi:DUF2953 domain-containing protein [Sporolactobacillus sp. KGMB 08714]|uniref:DUF2953 domain-containing protein n=1 Tax=Sporolactobacillus sp. KGMB 08714 TaxID=3064704 RepID=UPI002FBEEAD4